jgi:hypothetical protein
VQKALYEMAWSQPIQSLAKSLSLSDRGLAKICAAANIPVPARGYWAKKQAGKRVDQIRLPARGLGQSDTLHIGRDRYSASEDAEILSAPIPPAPVFEPDMTRSRLVNDRQLNADAVQIGQHWTNTRYRVCCRRRCPRSQVAL